MLGNNKGRVKFNFSLSSFRSQRFGIKFYFWRLVQQGAKGKGRQVTYTSTACKRLSNPQKHTHTSRHAQTCTHTQTPDTNICGSHEKFNFLTLLVHTCKGRRREPKPKPKLEPEYENEPEPNSVSLVKNQTKQAAPHSCPECVWGCSCLSVCQSVCLPHSRV